MIIGLSGVAGSGKDLFFTLMRRLINVKRFSLADNLKEDVNNFTLDKYGIHALNCSREDKEIIRPLLLFHGSVMRKRTSGRHWTEMLQKQINHANLPSESHVCITDIRYDEYEKDEVHWLKNEMNGILIHISQFYTYKNSETEGFETNFLLPPNELEEKNDPKLKEAADFRIEWPKCERVSDAQRDFSLIPFAEMVIENFQLK